MNLLSFIESRVYS